MDFMSAPSSILGKEDNISFLLRSGHISGEMPAEAIRYAWREVAACYCNLFRVNVTTGAVA